MRFSSIPLFLALAGIGPLALAQQAPPQRVVGAVTAINDQLLTIKPDIGAPVTVTVSDKARVLETQPGAKTLAGATSIPLGSIAIGDRVLAIVHPSADGSATTATTLVAMKQADVAQHQQAEQADWQRRGVGGLVKTVDAAVGTVTIAYGARVITIHATPKTTVRRYSPDSIKFSDAQPSTLAQIQPGDQLRARGDRSADGNEVTAEEIVAGTFRNIAGTVISTDPAANSITVTDLATRKPVIIHVAADSQMHKLPEEMAQALAMRLKHSGSGQAQDHGAASSERRQAAGGGQHSGDLTQMLQRTPSLRLSELHKGDAVMVVATQGTPGSATAVTLLAGVEPILAASPAASQSMFSASWNVGGGGSAGMGDEGTP